MKFRIGHAADAANYLGLSSEEVLHFPGRIESIKHRDRDSIARPASRGNQSSPVCDK
jgi:hypothetical protein